MEPLPPADRRGTRISESLGNTLASAAGPQGAAFIARKLGLHKQETTYAAAAEWIRKAVEKQLWNPVEQYYPNSIRPENPKADISLWREHFRSGCGREKGKTPFRSPENLYRTAVEYLYYSLELNCLRQSLKIPFSYQLAERVGFEPTVELPYTTFPMLRLRPLGHLSVSGSDVRI